MSYWWAGCYYWIVMNTLGSEIDEVLRVESVTLIKKGGGERHVLFLFVNRDLGDNNNEIKVL